MEKPGVNRIDFRYEKEEDGNYQPKLYIDGAEVVESLGFDLRELIRSGRGEGEFFPITCVCGQPECADIDQGIIVERDGGCVKWKIRNPIVLRPEDRDKAGVRYDFYVFDEAQYLDALRGGLEQAKRIWSDEDEDTAVGTIDFVVKDLKKLNL